MPKKCITIKHLLARREFKGQLVGVAGAFPAIITLRLCRGKSDVVNSIGRFQSVSCPVEKGGALRQSVGRICEL